MPNPTIPAAGGAMPAEGPRAAAVFGANEITAATCSLVREADEGAGVTSIEIRQKPFRVGRMNHNVPIAMKDNDAIDLAMRGWAVFYRQPPAKESYDEALTLFEQALKIDPNYAEALTGSAVTSLNQLLYGWKNPAIDYQAKILDQAERAISLAPGGSDAYYVKSFYLYISRRWNDSLGAANAGLAIDPNNAALYSVRGLAEISLGNFERAKSDAQQSIRLSPRDPFVGGWHLGIGDAELGLGHFDAAIDAYHKTIDLGFRAFQPYVDLAATYALEGKMDESKAALTEARRLNPQLSVKWLRTVAPDLPPLFEGVRKAGLPEQ